MPNPIVLAGPNGAGKSTIAPVLLDELLAVDAFVNADAIAQGLSAFAPERVAFQAGRVMLERLRELADAGADFAFETTLASRTFAPFIRAVKASGYRVRLVYLWLDDADLCVQRVAARRRAGGHAIDEPTIRRRYERSVRNLFGLYRPLADHWQVYDNSSGSGAVLVAEGNLRQFPSVYVPATWNQMVGRASR